MSQPQRARPACATSATPAPASRIPDGDRFRYLGPDGKPVSDDTTL